MELAKLERTRTAGFIGLTVDNGRDVFPACTVQWQGGCRYRTNPVVEPTATGDAFLDRTSLLILADDWFGKWVEKFLKVCRAASVSETGLFILSQEACRSIPVSTSIRDEDNLSCILPFDGPDPWASCRTGN